MSELPYNQLVEKLTELFEVGDYAKVMVLADKHLAEYPEYLAHLNYLRICSAARMRDFELSIAILREMLDKGIWYSEELLTSSPSLMEMQDVGVFQELVQQSMKLKDQSFGSDQTLMVLHDNSKCKFTGQDDVPCPVLVALHSNGELPQETLAGWKSAAQIGWLVAVPKSSKRIWAGSGHFWVNHHEASSEIYSQLSTLQGNYYTNEERLVFGGFYMGAEIALWMTLQGMMNAKGFVLLAPDGPYFNDPIRWRPLIEDAQDADLRGVIIASKGDDIKNEEIRAIVALLNEYRISTKLIFINNIDDQYPVDFSRYLIKSLEYIFP